MGFRQSINSMSSYLIIKIFLSPKCACGKKYFKTKGYESLVFFSFHEPRPSLTGILIWTMASINNVGLE